VFCRLLRQTCRFIGSSLGVMQKGHMRFEPNINCELRLRGGGVIRTPIVEIKNLNSFRAVHAAIACELEQQPKRWVEGGATEFPMLYMTSGGAVVHETMHMIAHGVLANNEWREGWLDEGMASFLTNWLREERGAPTGEVWGSYTRLAQRDVAGEGEPVGLPGADFSSYAMYSSMTYGKGAAILVMLRDMLGEEVFREGLREYYERHRFHQVTREDFEQAMEDVSGRELDGYFDQWLETTFWVDYSVADVTVEGEPGAYTVTVEVAREGEAWMPVVVAAGDARETLEGRERTQTVVFELEERPEAIVLDPMGTLFDPDRENNVREVR